MARLCSLAQPGTESNIFFIYTMSCFRKDLKRGDKHLVNTLDQMLKTLLGVVGNARENTFCFAFFTLSWDYNSLGDTSLLRRQLNHNSTCLGTGSLDTWVVTPSSATSHLCDSRKVTSPLWASVFLQVTQRGYVYVCMSTETDWRDW